MVKNYYNHVNAGCRPPSTLSMVNKRVLYDLTSSRRGTCWWVWGTSRCRSVLIDRNCRSQVSCWTSGWCRGCGCWPGCANAGRSPPRHASATNKRRQRNNQRSIFSSIFNNYPVFVADRIDRGNRKSDYMHIPTPSLIPFQCPMDPKDCITEPPTCAKSQPTIFH